MPQSPKHDFDVTPWEYLGVRLLVGVLVVLVVHVVYRLWFERRCHGAIRLWARENDYVLLRLERGRCAPGEMPGFFQRRIWSITVQDDEGGHRDGTVHFGHWLFDLPWGKMTVRWQ